MLVSKTILPPALPSVTLSSSVPFTCEKHHWMSLLPEKRQVKLYLPFILMFGKVMLGESTFWAKFTPASPLFQTYPSYFGVSTSRLTKIWSARDLSKRLVCPDTTTDLLSQKECIYFVWNVRKNFTMQWRPGRDCSAEPWRQASLSTLYRAKLHRTEQDTRRGTLYFVFYSKPRRQISERFREFVEKFK